MAVGSQHMGYFFRAAAALDAFDGFAGDIGVRPAGHAVGEFKLIQAVQFLDGILHGGDSRIIGQEQGPVDIPTDVFHDAFFLCLQKKL